ncbi:MAG: heavy-metal-associated domain-containing protein [Terriglobia bacterium]
MRRLEGVGDVKVDLKEGKAVVKPAAGKSFDPTRIPKAVKDAGFSPREIEVTAVGTLNARGELLLLETGAPTRAFALAGGEKADELGQRGDLRGQRVRVTGKLHPSHADRPPGLTVERWEAAPRP